MIRRPTGRTSLNESLLVNRHAKLTTGPVGRSLIRLTLPMVMGLFGMVAFNVVDTYFVAQLGTRQLAAMSFTFPVVMFVGGIALGLGVGAASVISRAIGEGDTQKVRRLTTHGLVLSIFIVVLFVTAGLFSIDPLFRLLGATPGVLPLIREYMTIWYVGMVFVVVPMVGNNAIRAAGDAKYPGFMMVVGASINVILDPLLIFGLLGFPRLELRGAALATVFARATTLLGTLAILHFRERMLDFSSAALRHMCDSCKRILFIAVPAAGTRILTPLSMAVITRLAAGYGPGAVAAVGTGTRVQAFALLVVAALCSILVPFIGQNSGAGRTDRAELARHWANRFSFVWGLFCLVVFLVVARGVARLFSDDPQVVRNIVLYLSIVPIGFGLQGISMVISAALNAVNRPLSAAALNLVRMFALYVPLTFVGSRWFAMEGLFGGVALANVLAGIISLLWMRRICKKQDFRTTSPELLNDRI